MNQYPKEPYFIEAAMSPGKGLHSPASFIANVYVCVLS